MPQAVKNNRLTWVSKNQTKLLINYVITKFRKAILTRFSRLFNHNADQTHSQMQHMPNSRLKTTGKRNFSPVANTPTTTTSLKRPERQKHSRPLDIKPIKEHVIPKTPKIEPNCKKMQKTQRIFAHTKKTPYLCIALNNRDVAQPG